MVTLSHTVPGAEPILSQLLWEMTSSPPVITSPSETQVSVLRFLQEHPGPLANPGHSFQLVQTHGM